MNKQQLIDTIMGTEGNTHKISHLTKMRKEELEAILESLTAHADMGAEPPMADEPAPDVTATQETETQDIELDALEKQLLATIPEHPEYKNAESVMIGRDLLKKAAELHGMARPTALSALRSLRKKGYCTKIRNEGERLNKTSLTPLGVQYLTDNGLLAV